MFVFVSLYPSAGIKTEGDTKKKRRRKQDACCYKYDPRALIGKLCKCILSSITRCIHEKVFSVLNPKLEDYEFAGVSLDRLKDKLLGTKKSYKQVSLAKVSVKDLQLLKGVRTKKNIKKYCLSASKVKILVELMDDYDKGNLRLGEESQYGKKQKKLNKKKLHDIIEEYEMKKRIKENQKKAGINIEKLSNLDMTEWKKQLSLTGSKGKLFDQLVDEYKAGKKSLFKEKMVNKENIIKILEDFGSKRKNNKDQKQHASINIEQFKNLDKSDLKLKLSLTGTKSKLSDQLMDTYKIGKISLSKLTNSKTYPKNVDKKNIEKMSKLYKVLKTMSKSKILSENVENIDDKLNLSTEEKKIKKGRVKNLMETFEKTFSLHTIIKRMV